MPFKGPIYERNEENEKRIDFSSGTGDEAKKIHNGKSFIMGSILFKRNNKFQHSFINICMPHATDRTMIETETPIIILFFL